MDLTLSRCREVLISSENIDRMFMGINVNIMVGGDDITVGNFMDLTGEIKLTNLTYFTLVKCAEK